MNKEGICFRKMKKKYVIIIIVILLVCFLIASGIMFIYNQKSSKEAIKFLGDKIAIQVYVDRTYENTDEIQEKLQNTELVRSVEFISKEETFENIKNELGNDLLEGYSSDVFMDSFIVQFDIDDVKDIEKLQNVKTAIENFDGISRVETDSIDEIINAYKKDGIKGIIECKNKYEELDKQLQSLN